MNKKLIIPIAGLFVFFISLIIYIFTICPTVPPYRDSGELISVIHKLGIAHPPGYPLYTIVGKAFTLLPIGNIAYRVNIMSAVFGSLTSILVFFILLSLMQPHPENIGVVPTFMAFGATSRCLAIHPRVYPPMFYSVKQYMGDCRTHGLLKIGTKKDDSCLNSGTLAAFSGSLVFSFSYTFWYLSLVSEMYTMDAFFIALLILMMLWIKNHDLPDASRILSLKYIYLFCFLAGLALTNRLTIILCLPAFAYYIFYNKAYFKNIFKLKYIINMLLFVLLGLAAYFYLPLRSSMNPSIDWGDPQTLERFLDVLTRKAYGHSLDRVSEKYKLSEVLIPQLLVYCKSLLQQYTLAGLAAGFYGFICLYHKKIRFFIFSLLFFLLSGPLFIVLSKMPSNAHALAIVETSYIPPNLIIALWIGFGIYSLLQWAGGLKHKYLRYAGLIILILPVISILVTYKAVNKKGNYFAYDYAENILNSVQNKAIIIMRKDVPLFSLWYLQEVEGKRADVTVIAQGLFLSAWYNPQLRLKHPEFIFPPPVDASDKDDYLKEFIMLNMKTYPVYINEDLEVEKEFYNDFERQPEGLLTRLLTKGQEITVGNAVYNLYSLYKYRGVYNSTLYKDFFTPDIISRYALGHNDIALFYFNKGLYKDAEKEYLESIRLAPDYAPAYYNLGTNYYSQGLLDKSINSYNTSIKYYRELSRDKLLAKFIMHEIARVYNNLGASYERKNDFDNAIKAYYNAINNDAAFEEPYYNMGVIYWKQNKWAEVVSSFKKALTINPNHQNARAYLPIAIEKQKNSR